MPIRSTVVPALKPKVLFVHQGAQLYGSDRIFAQAVLCASDLLDPVIVLPENGPLVTELQGHYCAIHFYKLGILRRKHLTAVGIFATAWDTLKSTMFLYLLIRRNRIRGVYSSTLAVITGALAAKLAGVPHVWHVHEIIVRPRVMSTFYSLVVPALSTTVICNSRATRDNLLRQWSQTEGKAQVVYNGIDVRHFDVRGTREETRRELGVAPGQILVTVIGRVHFWKGQDYLLRSAASLKNINPEILYWIVGDSYDSVHDDQVTKLKQLSAALGIESVVKFTEFEPNAARIYEASDFVVVPSQFPEPFGLVTIEAMASSKPVIATAHGGSLEIVEDGITGFLIPVNKPQVLAEKIKELAENSSLRRTLGAAGRQRAQDKFNAAQFEVNMKDILGSVFCTSSTRAG